MSQLTAVERTLQALGDRTRLRLLNLISRGEICVCFFVVILDLPQPKISRHLAYLRRAGLVSARRDGKWVHYRLDFPADPAARTVVESTLAAISDDRELARDAAALNKVCCGIRLPAALRDAPRPVVVSNP